MARKPRYIKLVRPNVGLEMEYKRKIEKLVRDMHASVDYWLRVYYKRHEPEVVSIAKDASPANELKRAMRKLSKRWQKNFDDGAGVLANHFAKSVSQRSKKVLQKNLHDAGITVEFKLSKAQNDILQATINQNVSLIKSIPQKYFTDIGGMVMRSVQTGRDLGQLTKDLEKTYGVTRRRAAFIARDQNNKATSALNNARQLELGISEAEWVHSGGGHRPRPTHVAAGKRKQRYKLSQGWYDPAVKKYIYPGQEPNCGCLSRSIIPGL